MCFLKKNDLYVDVLQVMFFSYNLLKRLEFNLRRYMYLLKKKCESALDS